MQRTVLIVLAFVFRVYQTHSVWGTIEAAWSNSEALALNSSGHPSVSPPPHIPHPSLFLGHSYRQPHLEISSKVYIGGPLWLEGPLPPAEAFSVTSSLSRIQECMIYPRVLRLAKLFHIGFKDDCFSLCERLSKYRTLWNQIYICLSWVEISGELF